MQQKSDLELLRDQLSSQYDLADPVLCTPLRSYTNDVYSVNSGSDRFALKIYGLNWRSDAEIRYELELLLHLARKGLQVGRPVDRRDGDFLSVITTRESNRLAALFTFAPGRKPAPPFSLSLYESFGEAIARMHTLSDDFRTEYVRRPLDINTLVVEPLESILDSAPTESVRRQLQDVGDEIQLKIEQYSAAPLDWGPIHGDATLDNLHVTESGQVILYDFDSGGPGYRASDLQGWAVGPSEFAAKHDAFLRGYSQIRTLNSADLMVAPYLTLAWEIWGLGVELSRRHMSPAETEAYLRDQATVLSNRCETLAGLQ